MLGDPLGWIRQTLGVEAPPPAPKRVNPAIQRKLYSAAASEESQEVRLQRMVRKQEVEMGGLEEEIKELNDESAALVKKSRDPSVPVTIRNQCVANAKTKLTECAKKRAEMQGLSKKLVNLKGQLSVMQTANANLEHALLIQQGADELESTVVAMNGLEVEESVSRLQDAAAEVHEHNALLTEDMGLAGPGHDTVIIESQVDDELEALMREQHDEQMDALLGQLAMAAAPVVTVVIPNNNQTGQTVLGEEKTI
ncbi:MAG: hypothetical protein ABIP54_00415 [Candidatus Andersenbacteria bacterium]